MFEKSFNCEVYNSHFIWCRNCKKAVEWHLVEMATKVSGTVGNGVTIWYAQDLLCNECAFIIATFHENQGLANTKHDPEAFDLGLVGETNTPWISVEGAPTDKDMLSCKQKADWEILSGPTPDDYTHACTKHVGELLSYDVENHVHSAPKGTICCFIEETREEKAMRLVRESGKTVHASDCATSRAPAEEPGPCDCDVVQEL